MDGKRQCLERTLLRSQAVSRLEKELLAFTYECLRPLMVEKNKSKTRAPRRLGKSITFAQGA